MNFDVARAMRPDAGTIRAAPMMSHRDIATQLLQGSGHRALDVGCGKGQFTKLLAVLFADVIGIDPRADWIAQDQSAAREAGLSIDYREGVAESLPFPDATFDVVSFSNSLHHFAVFPEAITEARRVLVPGGLLYVMEPVPAGNHFEATRLVNDETEIRGAAYEALAGADGWRLETELAYRHRTSFASYDEWKRAMIDGVPKRQGIFDRADAQIRSRFESEADIENGRLAFDHLYRVNLLRKN